MPLPARAAGVLLAVITCPAQACPGLAWTAAPFAGEPTLGLGRGLPFTIAVRGGGPFNLRDCGLEGGGLTGYDGDGLISVRPDLALHLREAPRLSITTEVEADTLLVIRDPAGRWHFDDNGRGQHPLVVITDPEPGEYSIFVGGHGTERYTREDVLIVSETEP